MNPISQESQRVVISLENIWRALLALGHRRLWIQPPAEGICATWQIVTWDGLTVAGLIRVSGNWLLTGDANAIYTNPEEIVPDGLEELTLQVVEYLMEQGI